MGPRFMQDFMAEKGTPKSADLITVPWGITRQLPGHCRLSAASAGRLQHKPPSRDRRLSMVGKRCSMQKPHAAKQWPVTTSKPGSEWLVTSLCDVFHGFTATQMHLLPLAAKHPYILHASATSQPFHSPAVHNKEVFLQCPLTST